MAFPPDLGGADEAGLFQHMQVFRHRLPSEHSADRKPCNRAFAPIAEGRQQRQARWVSEGGEQDCRVLAVGFDVIDRRIP